MSPALPPAAAVPGPPPGRPQGRPWEAPSLGGSSRARGWPGATTAPGHGDPTNGPKMWISSAEIRDLGWFEMIWDDLRWCEANGSVSTWQIAQKDNFYEGQWSFEPSDLWSSLLSDVPTLSTLIAEKIWLVLLSVPDDPYLYTESQTYAAAWSSTGLFSATLRFFVAGPSLSQGHPSWTRSSSYPSHLQLQWGAQPRHVGGCVGTPILCLALTKTTNYTGCVGCVGSPTL